MYDVDQVTSSFVKLKQESLLKELCTLFNRIKSRENDIKINLFNGFSKIVIVKNPSPKTGAVFNANKFEKISNNLIINLIIYLIY